MPDLLASTEAYRELSPMLVTLAQLTSSSEPLPAAVATLAYDTFREADGILPSAVTAALASRSDLPAHLYEALAMHETPVVHREVRNNPAAPARARRTCVFRERDTSLLARLAEEETDPVILRALAERILEASANPRKDRALRTPVERDPITARLLGNEHLPDNDDTRALLPLAIAMLEREEVHSRRLADILVPEPAPWCWERVETYLRRHPDQIQAAVDEHSTSALLMLFAGSQPDATWTRAHAFEHIIIPTLRALVPAAGTGAGQSAPDFPDAVETSLAAMLPHLTEPQRDTVRSIFTGYTRNLPASVRSLLHAPHPVDVPTLFRDGAPSDVLGFLDRPAEAGTESPTRQDLLAFIARPEVTTGAATTAFLLSVSGERPEVAEVLKARTFDPNFELNLLALLPEHLDHARDEVALTVINDLLTLQRTSPPRSGWPIGPTVVERLAQRLFDTLPWANLSLLGGRSANLDQLILAAMNDILTTPGGPTLLEELKTEAESHTLGEIHRTIRTALTS